MVDLVTTSNQLQKLTILSGQGNLCLQESQRTRANPCSRIPQGEVLLDHLGDDGAPVPPPVREALVVHGGELSEMILEEAIER